MAMKSWESIEVFLSENKYEFTHLDQSENIEDEIIKINEENKNIIDIITGNTENKKKCKTILPVIRRICQIKDGKYVCITVTIYKCIKN